MLILGDMGDSDLNAGTSLKHSSPATPLFLAIGLVAILILAWLGRVILLLFFAAIVVAALVTVSADWLGARLRVGRKVAFALILIAAVCLLGSVLWLVGPSIIDQFTDLQTDLPNAARQLMERLTGYPW